MARVKLNGNDLGVLWKAPYRVEIGQFAKAGENTLEIEVTNLWINRMIGDENLPEDSERNGDGTLKAWPNGCWTASRVPPAGRRLPPGGSTEGRSAARIRAARAGDVASNAARCAAVSREVEWAES